MREGELTVKRDNARLGYTTCLNFNTNKISFQHALFMQKAPFNSRDVALKCEIGMSLSLSPTPSFENTMAAAVAARFVVDQGTLAVLDLEVRKLYSLGTRKKTEKKTARKTEQKAEGTGMSTSKHDHRDKHVGEDQDHGRDSGGRHVET